MAIKREYTLYEVLVRFAPDGTLAGAHQCEQEIVRDGEEIVSHKVHGADPLDPKDIGKLFGDERTAVLIAQIELLKAENRRLFEENLAVTEISVKLMAENQKLKEVEHDDG